MDFKQIADELAKVTARYIDKTGRQPSMDFTAHITDDGRITDSHYEGEIAAENLVYFRSHDPVEFFANINAYIDGLETEAERETREFREMLAATIEKGREVGIEENVMAGVVDLSKRLSENAITDQSE